MRGFATVAVSVAAALAVLAAQVSAQTEKRVALVIGNAAYKDAPLKNPVNDARAMTARLRQLGFDVVARENATRHDMASAVAEFARKLTPESAALVYYAGHGVQSRGRNYLIPVDAALGSETDLRFQAVDVGTLTDELDQAQSRVSFLILDACRNNPFERRMRGAARGLAAVDAARGTLIAYATAPGSVAADGDGNNGVYTTALLKALSAPGLKAEEVFKRVRIEVTDATRNQQTPWESSSLTGDFVFNLSVTVTPTVSAPAQADRGAADLAFWNAISTSGNAQDYEDYLTQFPAGTFAPLARRKSEELKRKQQISEAEKQPAATLEAERRRQQETQAGQQLTALPPPSAAVQSRKPMEPTEIRQRAYEKIMALALAKIVPEYATGSLRQYIGKPSPYRSLKQSKALAACLRWVGASVDTIEYAHDSASIGFAPSSMSTARETAMKFCANHVAKNCTCQFIDENDRNVLQVPTEFYQRAVKAAE